MRTIFNFLGPLTNPAGATRQVIGVSDPAFLDVIAGALARLGRGAGARRLERGRPRRALHLRRHARGRGRGRRRCAPTTSTPEEVGLARSAYEDVAGGPPDANAATTRRIFAGERGPARDLAVLERRGRDLRRRARDGLEAGVRAAEAALDGGGAADALDRLVALTGKLSPS